MTTSARISWLFPPEDLIDAGYQPSLWRVQKTAILLLVLAVLGPIPIHCMLDTGPDLHWQIQNASENQPFLIPSGRYFNAYADKPGHDGDAPAALTFSHRGAGAPAG